MKYVPSTRNVVGACVPSSRPGAQRLLWRTALVLALASGSVMAQPVAAKKLAAQVSASVLSEIGLKAQALGLSKAQVEGLLANLRVMDMQQLRDMGELRNQSQLERLVPGATAAAGARAPVDPSRPGTQGAGNTGGASQQGVNGALRPGLAGTGRQGQLSSCQACDGGFGTGGQSGQSTNPESKNKTVTTGNGGSIDIHNDGSAKITNANGSVEYLNSNQRIVDKNNNAVTPNPNSEASSNRVYAHDLAALQARLGANRTPNPNAGDQGGTGGGISGSRSNPVGSRATFVEPAAGVARVNITALTEAIRIAVERVAGPKVGNL